MKAIILAAGKGSRLNGTAGNKPKCLIKVGEQTLICRQIEALRASGVNDIVVVVGFEADAVRRSCGAGIEYIENPIFNRTNSLYSLWFARDRLADGFVVMNSDVLFDPQLLTDLVTARHEDALLVAYQDDGAEPLGDEEMKVKVRAGRVVDISKVMDPREADGENVGIAKFGPAGAEHLIHHMDRLIAEQAYRAWAPQAFRDFAQVRPLHAIGTRGLPWIEIDFPEDYKRAVREVLPRIEAADQSIRRAAGQARSVSRGDF